MADRASDVSCDVEMRLTDGKRHDHEVHEQEHQFAVDEAAEDGTFDKYAKLSTGEIVDGRGRERDGEVTHKANRSGCPPHLTRPSSKDTSSDTLQDSEWRGTAQTESNKSLSDIEDAGKESALEDRCKGFWNSLHTVPATR